MARVKQIDLIKNQLEMYKSNPELTMSAKGWSKAEYQEQISLLEKKITQSKRGKSNKAKGGNYERKVAKYFKDKFGIELVRTPLSGGFQKNAKATNIKGDISNIDDSIDFKLHIECKSHKSISLKEWLRQAESDCPSGRIPTVVFHRPNTSKDYIAISYKDFANIINYTKNYTNPFTDISPKEGEMEEWAFINGYNNEYQISNFGRLKSIKGGKERLLKPCVGSSGYLNTTLTKDGKCTSVRIHKLVSEYFLDSSLGEVVNHIDGNKLNNYYKNLEVITYSENNSHAYTTGLKSKGEQCYLSKLTDRQILDIRLHLGFNNISVAELAILYGVSDTTISRIKDINYRNPLNLYLICKDHSTWAVPKWIEQSESDCAEGKIPIVVMHRRQKNKDGQRTQESGDYVVLNLFDFMEIVNYNKIIEKR